MSGHTPGPWTIEKDMVKRPKTASEWTGEDLPPVGTTIEANGPFGSEWRKVEVLAHYKGFAVCGYVEEDGSVFVDNFPSIRIRAIRTPEQIAAEEREKFIDEMIKATCIRRGEAGLIYDASYRKQGQE